MTVAMSALQAARTKLATVALVSVVATGGHAVARNHDVQQIRFASSAGAAHDRAIGPMTRG